MVVVVRNVMVFSTLLQINSKPLVCVVAIEYNKILKKIVLATNINLNEISIIKLM